MAYGEEQIKTGVANAKQASGETKPSIEATAKLGIFPDEFKVINEVIKDKDTDKIKLETTIGVQYANLSAIHDVMAKVKESGGNKDDKFLNFAKEFPMKFLQFKNPINGQDIAMSNFQYFGMAMALIHKYLVDQIDSEIFIKDTGIKDDDKLDFNKDKSELNIYGTKIKIALKNDKPTDHFILEAIFANPDKTEETYFKDIAQDFIKIEEYDSSKHWSRFRHACENLNKKVDNSTNGRYKEFIEYHYGKTGWCKINPKYL